LLDAGGAAALLARVCEPHASDGAVAALWALTQSARGRESMLALGVRDAVQQRLAQLQAELATLPEHVIAKAPDLKCQVAGAELLLLSFDASAEKLDGMHAYAAASVARARATTRHACEPQELAGILQEVLVKRREADVHVDGTGGAGATPSVSDAGGEPQS